MRVVQIIDSLEAGGAERMAVSYANALAQKKDFSGLVATRKEGALLNQINDGVSYLFLKKKSALDLKSVFRLKSFVKKNQIEIIHAHGTSFFLAFLLKLTQPSIKLIWHDHYGDSEFLSKRPMLGLKMAIPFFDGIIAVNQKLKVWAEKELNFNNTIYLPNFPSKETEIPDHTVLKGIEGKRIVCLANLRVQKNHFLLLEVAKRIKESHPEWSFHLVGKDFRDDYSEQIRRLIIEFDLENTVFLYGSKQDVKNILDQSTIAILTSQSEGLPVALLEYGWHKKPVVVTQVGEISLLIKNGVNGFIVDSKDVNSFNDSLVELIGNEMLRSDFGNALYQIVIENYSEETVMKQYLKWLQNNMQK